MKVYVLLEPCSDSNYDEDGKVLGVFASPDAAKRARQGDWRQGVDRDLQPVDGVWEIRDHFFLPTRRIEEHEVQE